MSDIATSNTAPAPAETFRSDTRIHRARRGIAGTYRGYTKDGEKVIFRVWSFPDKETGRPVIFVFPASYWNDGKKEWSVDRRHGEKQPHLPGCVLFGQCDLGRLPNVDLGNAHIKDWADLMLDCMEHYNARQRERADERRAAAAS